MTIDSTTCKPGPYRVVFEGLDRDAFRLSHKSQSDWLIQKGHDLHLQTGHYGITVLHRLVPEAEEKVLDVPIPMPWDTLRAAADLLDTRAVHGFLLLQCRKLANRLEAEHRAAQEKAEQDAAREALIEKAAQTLWEADRRGARANQSWDLLIESDRETYRAHARALADAGYLAEAGDES